MAKRVLHLIDTGGPGGAETIFLEIVEGLDPATWHSTPVVPVRDWLAQTLHNDGFAPLLIEAGGSFEYRYLWKLIRTIRRRRIDLVHAHLLTTGVYGSVAAALCGIPVITTLHGPVDVSDNDRYARAKLRIIARGRNRIVFVSQSLRRYFQTRYGLTAAAGMVIHNGIDVTEFGPGDAASLRRQFASADEVLIGAVGNVRDPKAYDDLLRAAAALQDAGVSFRLVIAGDARGELYEEIIRLRCHLGLEQRVMFLGFRRDIPQLLRALDIFVLSSVAEGFSLTTVQAMASGLPVVATRCGGPEEIVVDGRTGLLVPVRAPAELAAALERLARSGEERMRLGRAARCDVEQRFTKQTMIAGYDSLYRSLLGMQRMSDRIAAACVQV